MSDKTKAALRAAMEALEMLIEEAGDPSRQGGGEEGELFISFPCALLIERARELAREVGP